jgi:citrate synthase
MTTYVRSAEAARLLGVSPATLYAYVSRGRISRLRAADGRTSLFAVDEIDALRSASRRVDPSPRPTIDVQIASSITRLADDGVQLRGLPLVDLQRNHHFEDVAELLLTGELPATPTAWPHPASADVDAVVAPLGVMIAEPILRVIVAAAVLAGLHPDDDTAQAARRLLGVAPNALTVQTNATTTSSAPDPKRPVPDPDRFVKRSVPDPDRFAGRLARVWVDGPSTELIDAIDTALVLLADHELATSTLAVRIAASVRSSPYTAIVAGLATVEGALHGSAAASVHRFLDECLADEPSTVVARARAEHRRIPGFGHKVYRHEDPRFAPLLDAVRRVAWSSSEAGGDIRLDVIDVVLAEILRVIPSAPNVDFALGALSWVAGLPDDVPIFAVARIAGWAAHYDEELTEAPVRFRGLARTPT